MRRDLLRSPRLQIGLVATCLLGVLGAGAVSAVSLSASTGAGPAEAAAIEAGLGNVPARAARDRTGTPESAVQPSAVDVMPAAEVAPLAALHAPDLVVRSASPLAPELVQRLRGLEGVVASALLDAGVVTLAGGESRLLGVDASEFRGFTPQETAASDALWQAVARGDIAVGYALAQERSLPLGGEVPLNDATARLGAVAAFGLPGADVVATRAAARGLGAVPDSVVVLAAPDLTTATLRKAVQAVAGDVEIELLRQPDVAPSATSGKPASWRELYIDSARYCPGLSWTVLASIGQVESAHGKHLGPSSAGALGPMQFLPATWAAYGIDGDGDGTADILNPLDAVPSAASYLCRHGAARGDQGLYDAIWAYNHADWYVQKVLGIAAQYR